MEENTRTFRYDIGDIIRFTSDGYLISPNNKTYRENLTVIFRFGDGCTDVYVVDVNDGGVCLVTVGGGTERDTENEQLREKEIRKCSMLVSPSITEKWEEQMKKTNEAHESTQKQLREMLASMDAKAIADHQAEIDEKAHYRKLRGDIFLEFLRKKDNLEYKSALDCAQYATWELYQQDKEFEESKNDYEKSKEK